MTDSSEHFQYLAHRRRSRILLACALGSAILVGLWMSSRSARRHWLKTAPVKVLLESAESAENDHELVFTAAFRAYKDGRNDQAYRLMSGLVKRSPRNAEYWNGLGRTASAAGNAREAVAAYQRALELDRNLIYPRYYLGHIYAAAGLPTDAIREYEDAIKREGKLSDNPEPYARALSAKGRYQEAWDLMAKYFDMIRAQDSAYVLMGQCAQVLGKHDEARKKMYDRLQYTQMYPVPKVRVAVGRLILHQSKEAKTLEEALTLAQDAIRDPIPEAFAFLAEVRALRGDLEGAQRALDAGLSRDSDNPDCLRAQALLYDVKKMPAQASAIRKKLSSETPELAGLRRAHDENPEDATPGVALARELMKLGKPGAAGEVCHDVLRHNPGNEDAKQLLDQARSAALAKLTMTAPKPPAIGFAGS